MRSRSSWLRVVGHLLSDRLDQLQVIFSNVKYRLQNSLTDLLSQFVAETVQETVAATLAHGLSSTPPRGALHSDRSQRSPLPWWVPADDQAEPDPWEDDNRDDAPVQPPLEELAHPKLTHAVSTGCELTACLLKGWPQSLSTPAALFLGLLAAAASYVTGPWLGTSFGLALTGLQFLSLVQPSALSS